MWYAYIPPVPSPGSFFRHSFLMILECRAFEGRVIEVVSGDSLIVAERNPEGGFTETRIVLASIKLNHFHPISYF